MNPFAKISVFLLCLFLVCCGKVITIVEKPVPAIPEAKTEEKVQPPEVKPPEIKQKEEKLPAIQSPVDLPNRNAIGCVLPISGRYGDYGSKALDAILLAAGIFDEKNKTSWKIIAEDSRGLPEGVKAAVAHLAKTENAIAIIAVAGTAEAIEVAHEADKWKIPIILITPKEGVTSTNDYVFQHFLTPTQQIKALARYALNDLNYAIFSILYPQDDYGNEMVKIFRAEASRIGGKVERAVSYNKTQTDFTEEISKLTKNTFYAAKKTNDNMPKIKAPVSIDFEALFLPDSYQRVKMIASQLAFYDVKGIQLLGTSLWNSPDLLKKGAECLEGAVFADSFFVNGSYPETNDFVDIYYTAYSREPENIEALSYDTMGMIISVLEDKNIQTREQFITGLQQVENYKGATGNTSFSGDRVARKTAFILKVKDGKLEQVK
jgi:ABC-type branched-subunit amino acid transport system substrate-binding protein